MLGEIMSLRRPSEPSPASTTNSPPKFPLYLLPSLRIPFRRPRISEPAARSPPTASSETSSPLSSPVPSLSSSPVSSSSSSSSSASTTGPDSPTSPTSHHHHRGGGGGLSRAQPDTLRCIVCATDLAFHSQIVSKGFMGRHGRAYLVSPPAAQATPSCPGSPLNDADLVNVRVGAPERRVLVTGHHVVADISCATCGSVVGWKYVDARDAEQQYKVGKFILERKRVVGFHSWEDRAPENPDGEAAGGSSQGPPRRRGWSADAEDEEEGGGASSDGESVVVFDSDDEDECEDIFAGVWDPEVVAQRRKSRVLDNISSLDSDD